MSAEEWRPAVGYEGLYEISSLGRVRSLDRIVVRSNGIPHSVSGRILKTRPDSKGYPVVSVYATPGQISTPKVHKLIAAAFLGPCPPGKEVRHSDGDSANCTLQNLSYGTHVENMRDVLKHGRNFFANKTHCKHGHAFTEMNTRIRRDGGRECRACQRRRCGDWERRHGRSRRSIGVAS